MSDVRPPWFKPSSVQVCLPGDVLRLWRAGMDTRTIADRLCVNESTVANMLPSVLDKARHDDEWESRSHEK